MKNIPIGELLKESGLITPKQLETALVKQKENGKRIGAVLIELGFVTERNVLEALSSRLRLNTINLATFHINIDVVAKIPKNIALKYNAIAVAEENGRLLVAMNDPLDFYAQEDITQITGMHVEILLAETAEIQRAILNSYSEAEAKIAVKKANQTEVVEIIEEDNEDEDAPVIKLINSLLEMGDNKNISDIHIEPFEKHTSVRVRIDGVIIDYVTLAKSLHQSVIARIKIMSNLDIAEKRLPQDGHFKTTINNNELNIRVSIIPTIFGEKAVMRFLLGNDKPINNSKTFGMDRQNYKIAEEMLKCPHGIIYITGPTGSGKTTTLYMMLEELAKKEVNISTIEDPVEKHIGKVNQMQVNNVAGLTFDTGLRALLRQDPDIIMVGETRDPETASTSARAAITGHLVLSTLHTNDAVSSVVRLRDMGVPDYMTANSLIGAVAQRLMRKICPFCKCETVPNDYESSIIGEDIKTISYGKGCSQCNNTGYKGRIAVHEMFIVDKNIRSMIANGDDMQKIYDYRKNVQKMTSLKDNALELVKDGTTTIKELLKVTYGMD